MKTDGDIAKTVRNMAKIAIKILQGSAVTQNAIGGLITYRLFAIFCSVRLKNCEPLLMYVKVMSKDKMGTFETQCSCTI